MSKNFIDGLKFVQAKGDGGKRSVTQLLVIHATDNTASAENEASYASHRADEISAHVYVDDDSAVQALSLDHVAFGCYPMGNSRSIQFELTGRSNHISLATWKRAAVLAARVCLDWDIPVVHLTAAQVKAGTRGITGHDGVSLAFRQSDHTDPGTDFPWANFISAVKAEVARLRGISAPQTVPPTIYKPTTVIVKTLHRKWPSYMGPGDYFGLITGPDSSHGGYFLNERADVKAIQERLQTLGFAPRTTGWADGKFEQPTKDAVSKWQRAKYSSTTSRYGEVWPDDWAHLFTY